MEQTDDQRVFGYDPLSNLQTYEINHSIRNIDITSSSYLQYTSHQLETSFHSNSSITSFSHVVPPQLLQMDLPLSDNGVVTVNLGRKNAGDILKGVDDRLLVIVGPCSIHDVNAALEYATKLKFACEQYSDSLVIIMRAYFEKPSISFFIIFISRDYCRMERSY